jgi:Protein of unknown function (DUF3592)
MVDSLGAACLLLLVAGVAFFNLWPQWFLRLRSKNWPTVSGTIEDGEVSVVRGRYGVLCTATLSYSYRVDGEYYGGSDS